MEASAEQKVRYRHPIQSAARASMKAPEQAKIVPKRVGTGNRNRNSATTPDRVAILSRQRVPLHDERGGPPCVHVAHVEHVARPPPG